jgi:hypothetical protein
MGSAWERSSGISTKKLHKIVGAPDLPSNWREYVIMINPIHIFGPVDEPVVAAGRVLFPMVVPKRKSDRIACFVAMDVGNNRTKC